MVHFGETLHLSLKVQILNLNMDLHNIKKEATDFINTFFQKIKDTRDRLVAVGVQIDNVESFDSILYGSKTDEKQGSYGQNRENRSNTC